MISFTPNHVTGSAIGMSQHRMLALLVEYGPAANNNLEVVR